jgi:hypothetical protein
MAKIYNKETGWKSNNKKTNTAYQTQQDSLLSQPSASASNTTTLSDIENKNFSNINNISNPMYNHTEDFNILDSLTSIYNKKEIEETFKILGKMLPLYG